MARRKFRSRPNPGLWLFIGILAIAAIVALAIIILDPFGSGMAFRDTST